MSLITEQPCFIDVKSERSDSSVVVGGEYAGRSYDVLFHAEESCRPCDSLANYINKKTIMSGASKPWDKKRLVEGKLAKLEGIGELSVKLTSSQGDNLAASHMLHYAFMDSIKTHGGEIGSYAIKMNHPFFERASPIEITEIGDKCNGISGALIPYHPDFEEEFYRPEAFLNFLSQVRLQAVWEDTLEPVTEPGRWAWSSRKQGIIVMGKSDYRAIKNKGSNAFAFAPRNSYDPLLIPFFSSDGCKSDVIRFSNASKDFVEVLENLKIGDSPWGLVKCSGESVLVKKTSLLNNVLFLMDELKDSILSMEFTPNPEDQEMKYRTPGVVILSMNQTNSYTQYTHEILTFLLSGMDVFAYDNGGKGLSEGSVSEKGLKTAIKLSGLYLKDFGYTEKELLFKGQCAGGLPTCSAIKMFPEAHIWVDQSPNNFHSIAQDIFVAQVKQKAESGNSCCYASLYKSVGVLKSIVSALAKAALPSFDVIEDTKDSKGIVLYSIGIPDEQGMGGDSLVPKRHTDQFIQELGSREHSALFLPIVGGTHVTNWWVDPEGYDKVQKHLGDHGLIVPVFASDRSRRNPELQIASLIDQPKQQEAFDPSDSSEFHPLNSQVDEEKAEIFYDAVSDAEPRNELDGAI